MNWTHNASTGFQSDTLRGSLYSKCRDKTLTQTYPYPIELKCLSVGCAIMSCLHFVCRVFLFIYHLQSVLHAFSNNALAVHSTFSPVIADSLLPNQYLHPPIFHEEGLFFLSIAKLQKYPLIHFPFSFCILCVLFSPIPSLQMLIQIPHVRALPNLRCYSSLYPAVTLK